MSPAEFPSNLSAEDRYTRQNGDDTRQQFRVMRTYIIQTHTKKYSMKANIKILMSAL